MSQVSTLAASGYGTPKSLSMIASGDVLTSELLKCERMIASWSQKTASISASVVKGFPITTRRPTMGFWLYLGALMVVRETKVLPLCFCRSWSLRLASLITSFSSSVSVASQAFFRSGAGSHRYRRMLLMGFTSSSKFVDRRMQRAMYLAILTVRSKSTSYPCKPKSSKFACR